MSSWHRDKDLILAIDPGPESSGIVLYGGDSHQLFYSADLDNHSILGGLRDGGVNIGMGTARPAIVAIEDIVAMGMTVGKSVFGTCKWIGRFVEAYSYYGSNSVNYIDTPKLVSRRDVKTVLAGGTTFRDPDTNARRTVSDAHIKRVVKERFPETGGGKNPVVGTKGQPGPLYGLKGHAWSALAVALTYKEIRYN